MDNFDRRNEEICVLQSIFDSDFMMENDGSSFNVTVHSKDDVRIKLYFVLPDTYPSEASPHIEVTSSGLEPAEVQSMGDDLIRFCGENQGKPVIHDLILQAQIMLADLLNTAEVEASTSGEVVSDQMEDAVPTTPVPEIFSGNTLRDRKSVFQAHAAVVNHKHQPMQVLGKLRENKKINAATHNIYAYRIIDDNMIYADCADDGETGAGRRVLHLLETCHVENAIVIITRWYGGIHLGSDRFKHINNCAREILESQGLITRNTSAATSTTGKKRNGKKGK